MPRRRLDFKRAQERQRKRLKGELHQLKPMTPAQRAAFWKQYDAWVAAQLRVGIDHDLELPNWGRGSNTWLSVK